MSYSDFTLSDLRKQFHLVVEEVSDLFETVREAELPPFLLNTLERNLPLAAKLSTEKARSELLIAPILVEFKFLHENRVGLFSGLEFNVDEATGLKGRCDFLLTRNPTQLEVIAPVCVLVEAKNEDIVAGIPQCLAEMLAAQRFNRREEIEGAIYGIVTTGELWRFMKLDGLRASVDAVQYSIQSPKKIFGILTAIALN